MNKLFITFFIFHSVFSSDWNGENPPQFCPLVSKNPELKTCGPTQVCCRKLRGFRQECVEDVLCHQYDTVISGAGTICSEYYEVTWDSSETCNRMDFCCCQKRIQLADENPSGLTPNYNFEQTCMSAKECKGSIGPLGVGHTTFKCLPYAETLALEYFLGFFLGSIGLITVAAGGWWYAYKYHGIAIGKSLILRTKRSGPLILEESDKDFGFGKNIPTSNRPKTIEEQKAVNDFLSEYSSPLSKQQNINMIAKSIGPGVGGKRASSRSRSSSPQRRYHDPHISLGPKTSGSRGSKRGRASSGSPRGRASIGSFSSGSRRKGRASSPRASSPRRR